MTRGNLIEKYYDFRLSETRQKFGDHVLMLKSCCCHEQPALFPMATCRLTAVSELSRSTVGDGRFLRFGHYWK